ncbi:unnamed protein product, partial [Brenthis ino]
MIYWYGILDYGEPTVSHRCTLYSSHSHTPVGRLLDTTGDSKGAGPTALRALRGTGVRHRQLPNFGLLLRLTIQKDSINKLGPTRDSNPGPPGVQPYMLATTPPRQLNKNNILKTELYNGYLSKSSLLRKRSTLFLSLLKSVRRQFYTTGEMSGTVPTLHAPSEARSETLPNFTIPIC